MSTANPKTRWEQFRADTLRPLLSVEDSRRISLFDRSSLLLLALTAAWYLFSYFSNGSVPSNDPNGPRGWWDWWDQRQYYQCTADLAHGRIVPENYWFGYSVLGVPFYGLMPRHPYLIPDLVLVLVVVGSFFASCRHFVGRLEAAMLAVLFIFLEPFMSTTLIIPWNTLPGYAAIYLSTYLLIFKRPTLAHFAWCAALDSEALFSRPTDVFPLAGIYLIALIFLPGWRQKCAALACFVLAGALAAAISLGLNLHNYGDWRSPYMAAESQKFHLQNFGLKFYQLFCDGTFLTGQAALPDMKTFSILERYPLFLIGLPGFLFLLRTNGARTWGLALAMAAGVGFYLTYSTLANMPYFWTYSSFHYVWWIIPWLGFLSYLTLRRARSQLSLGLFFASLLGPPLLFLLIGFKTVSVAASDSPPRQLNLETHYADHAFTVVATSPADLNAVDLRLEFKKPPSYEGLGTSVVSDAKVKVWINGRPQLTMPDYFMSQHDSTFDFSFLVHGLTLKQGDRLRIQFDQTDEAVLTRVSLLDVVLKVPRFSP